MDGFDIALYISYVLVLVAVAGSILLPLYNSLGNPSSLKTTAIGIGALILIFIISYFLSGNEVTDVYKEFDVDASGSKTIGGMLTMMYLLIGLAITGIIYTEISKIIK